MSHRYSLAIASLITLCCLVSCAVHSGRMPAALETDREGMHNFLTQDNPGTCRRYHYNFERQAPRLYSEQKRDSILEVIEYIKTECGPAAGLEVTRLLLLADQERLGDTVIGSSTIPQMLWHRSAQERLLDWNEYRYLYGYSEPADNSHDNFLRFQTDLAQLVSTNPEVTLSEQILGQFYAGEFDTAFSRIQSDEMRGTALREQYDEYVSRIKHRYPERMHYAVLFGSWRPQSNASLLGNHPSIGLQIGGEGRRWRGDANVSYRFLSAKNEYEVDSLGQIVSTDKFNSLMFGAEVGYKFLDYPVYSADLFVGVGYDLIYSITEAGDPEKFVGHKSLTASIGLRQRVFVDQRHGWYIGGIVRYSLVDYPNPGGTDLSGNTWTVSLVTGWSIHETLKQFLQKLNYKGNYRE